MAQSPKTAMSNAHKEALAQGRDESRAVRDYLEALDQHRPRRGRKRTPESINKRLVAIEQSLDSANPMQRLSLTQERMDLTAELSTLGAAVDLTGLEKGFVAVAKSYSDRKGISFAAWRELHAPADVLKRAGIVR